MNASGMVAISGERDPPLRMDGMEFCQAAIAPPFAVAPPLAEDWRLYVVRGEGVKLNARNLALELTPLAKGAVIGMSGSTPHSFTRAGGEGDIPAAVWTEMPLGTQTAPNDVVFAVARIPQAAMPFIPLLGAFLRIDPIENRDATLRIGALFDWIAAETVRNDPMTGDVITRLAEIITIEIWRINGAHSVLLSEQPRDAEYDPRIWRTIAAISREPQRHWTVEGMAEIAGMSRSAFAARYHETVGQTPMRSLRRLRMHRAATSLASPGSQIIAPLADAMGYGSDAAFNRAFTKEFGHPPKRYGLHSASRGGEELNH